MKTLTPKQEKFVAEYLVDLNGRQAAIRAGYSAKTAEQQASRLLTKAKVQAAVAAGRAKQVERTQIDADWVLRRLAQEIEADLAELYDDHGALLPVSEWPLVWRKGLVSGIDTAHEYETIDGEKVSIGVVHKLKISDRLRRLELIGKHVAVGAFAERHEHTGKDGKDLIPPMTDTEIGRRLAFLLARGLRSED